MGMTEQATVKCPKCGSSQIHAGKRGWNIWTGFILSGRIVITCLACAHKFRPGDPQAQAPAAPRPEAPKLQPKAKGALHTGIETDASGVPTYKL